MNRFEARQVPAIATGTQSRENPARCRFHRLLPLLLSPLAAGIVHETALAQEAQSAGPIETVVVTSQFRAEDVQDVPIAVTAVTGAMLEARSETNIVQVSAQAPNVEFASWGQAGGSAMLAYIRGIGQTDFNFALEPGVGMYLDDVYYPNLTGSMLELIDLDRVEILRGPQGTLAGRNAIGGAIKLYSRDPGPGTNGNIEIDSGNYNRMGVRGAADVTLIDSKLYARVAGVARTQDGYVKRLDYRCVNPTSTVPSYSNGDLAGCELGRLGGQSFTGGRVSLLWDAAENVSVKFIFDRTNTSSDPGAQVLRGVNNATALTNGWGEGSFIDVDGDYSTTADRVYYSNAFVPYGPDRPANAVLNDPYVNYSTFIDPNAPLATRPYSPNSLNPRSELDQQGFSVQLDWDISDKLSLRYIAASRKYKDLWTEDTDGSPVNVQMLTQALRHEHNTNEIRLNGTGLNDRVDYTVGAFYVDQSLATHEANVNLFYAQLNFIHGPDSTPSDSKALFGTSTWHATDNLDFILGFRRTEDNKSYTYYRRNPDGTLPAACTQAPPTPPADLGNPPNCALSGLYNVHASFASKRNDYRIAVDYHIGDNVMIYAQESTGYKVGGINPRPFFLVQIETFKEEELTADEVGFKALFADGKVRLNGAYFQNDYTDIQLQQSACELPFPPFFGPPCLQPGNVGDGKSDGIELELETHPIDNLSIDASFSTLNFDYTRTDSSTAVTVGMVTPRTPEMTWSFGIQYNWMLGTGGKFGIRLDSNFIDDFYTEAINAPSNLIESHTVTNARLMWSSSDDNWEAALELANLTDEIYYTNIFDQYSSSAGQLAKGIAPPRMWAFHLKRNFSL
jgi:iron complex outermembrane recepter protein